MSMDPMTQSAGYNVEYEDIEPFFEWQTEDDSQILIVMLPGFRRDQLKVQVTSTPILKVSAQRQISGNKWRRVYKEFSVPPDCDTTNISAKFEGGILKVIFTKLITPTSKSPEREGDDEENGARLEDEAKSKGDDDKVSDTTQKVKEPARDAESTKEKGKTDNGVREKKDAVHQEDQAKAKSVDEVSGKAPAATQKEKEPAAASDDFTKEKGKKDNGVDEKNAVHQEDQEKAKRTDEVSGKTPPAKQKEKEHAGAVVEAHDEKRRTKNVTRMKTHLLDFTLSLRPSSSYQEDYKEAIAGLVERLKKMKNLMNLMLVSLLVVVFVLYVRNAFKSSNGGSEEQEL